MSGGDWITGDPWTWDQGQQGGGHAPPPVAKGRRRIEVLCCPACQDTRISRHDNGKSQAVVRWECSVCGHGWKESADLALHRVYAVG